LDKRNWTLAGMTEERERFTQGLQHLGEFDRTGDRSQARMAEKVFAKLQREGSALGAIGLTAIRIRQGRIKSARAEFAIASEALDWHSHYPDCWKLACEGAFLPAPRDEVVAFVEEGARARPEQPPVLMLAGILREADESPQADKWFTMARELLGDEFEDKRADVRELLHKHLR
jgi:hypothetical protein